MPQSGVRAQASGAPADAWLGEGIAEAVAVDLGGRTDAGNGAVRWLVRGAYQRVNDSLRITAELVDVAAGRTLNAVKIDGMVSDLFALQDELGRRLAETLRTHGVAGTLDTGMAPGGERNGLRPTDASPVMPAASRPAEVVSGAPGRGGGFAVPTGAIVDGPPPPIPPEVVSRDVRSV